MPYEPLHHKYRPQTFGELVGQGAIAQTLTHALESDRIAPAYLFTGPRGTGKTSSARILAKSLNCLTAGKPTATPCGHCQTCTEITRGIAMDIIEIDAASNTGVDNIREIIERAQFAPVQCRYKVYAIDECHMLSVAAFNALLKTLEEPPPRVVFILATTDPQRVLNTIISRCQRFDFRRIPLDAMVGHLGEIAKIEGIAIAPDALTLVAQIANGGLRDAESLLDQLSLNDGEIRSENVWDLVGAVPEKDLLALMQAIRSGDPEAIISQCRHLLDRGREPLILLQNLTTFYLNLLIAKTAPQRSDLIAVTAPTWEALKAEAQYWQTATILQSQQALKTSEIQIKQSTQPRLWLEVALLGLLPTALTPTLPQTPQPQPAPFRSEPPAPRTPPQTVTVPQPPKPNPQTLSVSQVRQVPKVHLNTSLSNSPLPTSLSPDSNAIVQQRLQSTWQQALDKIPSPQDVTVRQQCTLSDGDIDEGWIRIETPPGTPAMIKKVIDEAIVSAFQDLLKSNEPITVYFVVPEAQTSTRLQPQLAPQPLPVRRPSSTPQTPPPPKPPPKTPQTPPQPKTPPH
ncbi:DNA polymerase III subunit gamma/tau, partial [Spirulina sp. CCNP1310]|uniref:DNA polymerase III subunit gamma/tau n=1 Tax=Spirulina sp. CCNP1310 TaxID=3110249 RepID=UPI002B21DE0F